MSQFARDSVWSRCFVTGSDSSREHTWISRSARFYPRRVLSPNFTVTRKHLGSCSYRLINHILSFDWKGKTSHEPVRGRPCSFNLYVSSSSSSVHVTKTCRCAGHVFFFQITSSHAWLRFRSLSSLPLHTTQSGSCRRQATYCMSLSWKKKEVKIDLEWAPNRINSTNEKMEVR